MCVCHSQPTYMVPNAFTRQENQRLVAHHRTQPLQYTVQNLVHSLNIYSLNFHRLAAMAINVFTRTGKLLWPTINKAAFSANINQGHYSLYISY